MKSLLEKIAFGEWTTVKFSKWLWRSDIRVLNALRCFLVWLYRIIFTWRTARAALFTVAALVTLIAVGYTVENWRGHRAWIQAKRTMEANGETLDISGFIPPPVPDEQNFAMARPWSDAPGGDYLRLNFNHGAYQGMFHLLAHPYDNEGIFLPPSKMRQSAFGNMAESIPIDLKVWQQYYRDARAEAMKHSPKSEYDLFPIPDQPGNSAEDVLLALSRFDDGLRQLREAGRRPYSRFPVRYEDGFKMQIRHYGVIQSPSGVLRLRALAELELGREDAAYEEVKLQFRLAAAIQNEPLFIAHELRAGIISTALSTIWQGAAAHRWSDNHLAEFQSELEKLDFLHDYDRGMRFNRVLAFQAFQYMKRTRDLEYFNAISHNLEGQLQLDHFNRWAKTYRYMPAGWFDQNASEFEKSTRPLSECRLHTSASSVDIEDWRRRLSEAKVGPIVENPYQFLATSYLVYPKISWRSTRTSQAFFHAEALVRMGRIACALERYRLVHGDYPKKLEFLIPQGISSLPVDVFNGGPLHYQAIDADHFLLYSIGWNGRDDGGKGSERHDAYGMDRSEGDWVWKYPES